MLEVVTSVADLLAEVTAWDSGEKDPPVDDMTVREITSCGFEVVVRRFCGCWMAAAVDCAGIMIGCVMVVP